MARTCSIASESANVRSQVFLRMAALCGRIVPFSDVFMPDLGVVVGQIFRALIRNLVQLADYLHCIPVPSTH